MPATFSVPLRRPRSWPPPVSWAAGKTPCRATSAPTPWGPYALWALRLIRSTPRASRPRGSRPRAWTASVWTRRPRVAGADGAGDRGDVLDGADLVVGEHHGHQDRVGPDRGSHLGGIDPAAAIAADHGQLGPAGPGERVRGGQDRLVLDRADHQVAAPLRTPSLQHPAEGQVVGLGAARGEGDLAGRAAGGVGHPVPGLVHGGAGLPAVPVDRRRVAEPVPEPGQHRRPHLGVERGGGGVVQVEGLHLDQSTEPARRLPRASWPGVDASWPGLERSLGASCRAEGGPPSRRPEFTQEIPRPHHDGGVRPPSPSRWGRPGPPRRPPDRWRRCLPGGRMWRVGWRGHTRRSSSAIGMAGAPSAGVSTERTAISPCVLTVTTFASQ